MAATAERMIRARNFLHPKDLPSDSDELDRRPIIRTIHLKEFDMPQWEKPANPDKQKRQTRAVGKSSGPNGMKSPAAEARAWATAHKVQGLGKGQKSALGRKVPSGPVGGLGRKTNLQRSS